MFETCYFSQECLETFLQTKSGVQNHEFLLVHHLQCANYIPALQLNQAMKANLTVRVAALLSVQVSFSVTDHFW